MSEHAVRPPTSQSASQSVNHQASKGGCFPLTVELVSMSEHAVRPPIAPHAVQNVESDGAAEVAV